MAVASSVKRRPRTPKAVVTVGVSFKDCTDERDPDALAVAGIEVLDRVRRKEVFPVASSITLARDSGTFAGERRAEHARVGAILPAGLTAARCLRSSSPCLHRIVIADRVYSKPTNSMLGSWVVVERARSRAGSPDHVARADHHVAPIRP